MSELIIKPVSEDLRQTVATHLAREFGSAEVAVRGTLRDASVLPGYMAFEQSTCVGMASYEIVADECEIVVLLALNRWQGIGAALLGHVEKAAIAASCKRVWGITTNDNTDALRFYQRRGYRLCAIYPDAVTEARRLLKPGIPTVGDYGIALRDEIEFVKQLP